LGGQTRAQAKAGGQTAKWLSLPPTPALPPTARKGYAAINGINIFHAQFGAGPPVLLLHGGLANSNYWAHQIERLARDFSVIVMDTRGHGRSPVMAPSFSYDLFAADAVGLLDFLKIPHAALVGWSDGAVTGLRMAMTYPERVAKLFAFGANISTDGLKANGGRSPIFTRYVARCRHEYPTLSPHPERWPQLLAGLRVMWRSEPNYTKLHLGAVQAAAVIADGDHDEIIKRDQVELIAQAIPRARPEILPDVSHFAMLQDPEQFNRALVAFLTA